MEVLVSSGSTRRPVMSEVVTLLQPDTDYTVNVAALNQFGAGVPATVAVRTLPHSVRELPVLFHKFIVRILYTLATVF